MRIILPVSVQQMIKWIGSMILLVSTSMELYAQNTGMIDVINIPAEGVLLDSGWRYKVGDDLDWATANYDDGAWNDVRPAQDIKKLPMLWKDSIVWFRIYLKVDSLQVGDLAMRVSHAGASEIYLDGQVIQRYGVVSKNPEEVFAKSPKDRPASLPVSHAGVHLLAVRYRLEPNVWYTTEWSNDNFGLKIRLDSFANANENYERSSGVGNILGAFRISAFLILSILYFTFYISYRRTRTNLYFFIYAFSWLVVWSLHRYMESSLPGVRSIFYVANFSLVLQMAGWFFCLSAIYDILDRAKGWMFYTLCLLGVASIPLGMFVYPKGWLVIPNVFMPLAIFEIARISILATVRKKKGAWIMVIGAVLWLVLWILFALDKHGGISVIPFVDTWFVFSFSHSTLPLAIAIYLGYDFALTNRSLEQKLVEVEKLSEEKNRILSAQNDMLEVQVGERTTELTKSLDHLKATQAQLIQSEKMASLGELTAGIAHEIQNPLNFVNNFSDVNVELIDDLKKEVVLGNYGAVQEIADTIRENEDKINHHGKRADGIVKSMLQHSRTTSGQKELTNVNALCEEYTRLAYHGFRAKEKSFNARIETTFDPTLPKINLIPQDIGRVVLNLINNAFYAVNEKSKKVSSDYAPQINVTTRKLHNNIEIRIADNGDGIPDSIKEKIFQPFFTTKPTGQGTGLGLSLSYDIIKALGGKIEATSMQASGTEFVVHLPI